MIKLDLDRARRENFEIDVDFEIVPAKPRYPDRTIIKAPAPGVRATAPIIVTPPKYRFERPVARGNGTLRRFSSW